MNIALSLPPISLSLSPDNNSFLISGAMPPPLFFRISRAHDATCVRINKRNRALSLWFDWIARDRNWRAEDFVGKLLTAGYIEVKPTFSCARTRRLDIRRPNFERQCNETRALVAWSGRPIFFVCISVSRKFCL